MTVHRATAALLVLAFLLALVHPAQAGWACPDGTPCVHDTVEGYACSRGQCAVTPSCCRAKSVRCKHGAVPVLDSGADETPRVNSPEHCRYSITSAPQLRAVTESKALLLSFGADAVLQPFLVECPLPQSAPVWRTEYTLGYRPPPLLSLGRSRAPPAA